MAPLDAMPHDWKNLSDGQRFDVESQLQPGEYVVACFLPDLDLRLHYAVNLVVLTNRRVLSCSPEEGIAETRPRLQAAFHWQSWPLETIADVKAQDRAGLGMLRLLGHSGPLAQWRYTVACAAAAHHFVRHFESLRSGTDREEEEPEETEAEDWLSGRAPHTPKARSLLRLAKYARPCAHLIVIGFALTLVSTVASLVPPYLTIPLMDEILIPYQNQVENIQSRTEDDPQAREQQFAELQERERGRMGRIAWYLGGLAGAAVLAWVLAWAQGAVMAWVSERISANLRNQTYAHLLRLSLEYFSGKRTGDLIARISSDTDRICTFLSDTALDFGTDVLMIVLTAAILIWIDPILALASLVPLPLIAWLIYVVRVKLQHGFSRGGRAWGEMTSVLADSIPGIRVVKAFAQEQREIDRFRAANDRVVACNDRVNTVWTFFWPLVALLNQIGLLVVWAFGAWRVFSHQITVGVLTGFLQYIQRFYARLEMMTRMYSYTQRAAASAQRILEIIDRQPSVAEPAHPVSPGRLQGHVEFRRVGFRYSSRPVIDGVDLTIRPGEMIGLVGPSGAGKTTLINLICRFYDVTEGAILVDGTDVRSFPVEQYRRNIGVVLQEPFLFYGTVAENIAYGRPDATRQEIMAAARAARAHEFILRLADGYDSLVGERGQSLSGGERQRISIARALLVDPRILILDEATSSVDTETEREIQLALENLVHGRTTIAIAHRLSTLRRADRLVVLERGQIVETGRHDELLERCGLYARLYRAQLEMSESRAGLAGLGTSVPSGSAERQ